MCTKLIRISMSIPQTHLSLETTTVSSSLKKLALLGLVSTLSSNHLHFVSGNYDLLSFRVPFAPVNIFTRQQTPGNVTLYNKNVAV